METPLLAPLASLFNSLNELTAFSISSWLDTLPKSLPVTPCIPAAHNTTQIKLPDSIYFSIFFIFGGSLYLLLLLPFALRQKQVIAAPLVVGLTIAPLIFTSTDAPMFQLVHMGACGCVLMRMIDLYYVTPWRTAKEPTLNLEDWWTEIWRPFRKVPMTKDQLQRYELELHQSRLRREQEKKAIELAQATRKAKAEKALMHDNNDNDNDNDNTMNDNVNDNNSIDSLSDNGSNSASGSSTPSATASGSSTPIPSHSTTTTATDPLQKPHTRGKTIPQIYVPPKDPNPQHWSAYLPRWIFYAVLMDIIPFVMSFFTFEQIKTFSLPGQFLVTIAVGAMVIFDISLANYSLMIIWATVTGNLIHDTEWSLVRHYFPGFATSPAEFWRQWHHLFQYIWVDLGFKPVHHLLRKHVTNSPNVNRELARTVEMVLPIMGVFLMSGLMHEYMMVGMFHARVGHMTAFFLIQGAATIISKALNNTVGQRIQVPSIILIALTWAFNLSTASLFMEPVLQYEGYNIIAKQSMLIRAYNLLRSYNVF
ncbi:hypothetical protein BGZ94_001738 [Podila epigama]|nr:hypothetical protein BGZ94_001738 [Podila epigama]